MLIDSDGECLIAKECVGGSETAMLYMLARLLNSSSYIGYLAKKVCVLGTYYTNCCLFPCHAVSLIVV